MLCHTLRYFATPAAISALLLLPSCYLTSSFDGLTGASTEDNLDTGTPDAGDPDTGSAEPETPEGTPPPKYPAAGILDEFELADGKVGPMWDLIGSENYAVMSREFVALCPDPDAALWDESFAPRQEVSVTITSPIEGESEFGLIIKDQDDPVCNSLVADYFNKGGTRVLQIGYCLNNALSIIGEPIPLTLNPGDRLGMRGYDDGKIEVYLNNELRGTWDASGIEIGKLGGRVGFYAFQLAGPISLDDFSGGSF